jgi:predicted nucleotidyltransferase
MRIDSKGLIGEFPALLVRKVVRKLGSGTLWGSEAVQIIAGVDGLQAAALITAMEGAGLAKANSGRASGTWSTTPLAQRLRGASAAKPITRETAERALRELLERVKQVNGDAYYLARISKVVVFGSYLRPEIDRLGDLDVAVEVRPKEPDFDKRREATYRRLAELGRSPRSFLEQEFWWRGEVMHFLKAMSRAISLHDYGFEKVLIDAVPHKVVFSTREPKQKKPASQPAPARAPRRPRDCPF